MDNPTWYKDATFYVLNTRSFADSNGDGVGDFAGVRQRIDYIKRLGVDAVHFLPINASPMKDNGYDVADYYATNPAYGSVAEFKALVAELHSAGIRVMMDFVLNHTSNQHEWFKSARQDPKSPYRDWYIWSDTNTPFAETKNMFSTEDRAIWTKDDQAGQYYLHMFYPEQPDLNYDNPAVREEMKKVLSFWIKDIGVDAFRLDAVAFLFKREGTTSENLPETHAFLKDLRHHVEREGKELGKTVALLGEVCQSPEEVAKYLGEDDDPELHMTYNFPLMPRMYEALARGESAPIRKVITETPALPKTAQMATFARNHDEFTVGNVPDAQKFLLDFYAKNCPEARIYVGIRKRLASLMDFDGDKHQADRIKVMNGLLLGLPGTPFIYNGDEIGMGDNVNLPDRDGVRTPMQWTSGANAGFSHAEDPSLLVHPVITGGKYGHESVNVLDQETKRRSLLNWTRQMLTLRREHDAFGRGSFQLLEQDNPAVLAFQRGHEDKKYLCVYNLSAQPQKTTVAAPELDGRDLRDLRRPMKGVVGRIAEGRSQFQLEPYQFTWYSATERPELSAL